MIGLPSFAGDILLAVRGQQGAILEVPDPDEGMEIPSKRFQMILKSNTGKNEVFLVSKSENEAEQTQSSMAQRMNDIMPEDLVSGDGIAMDGRLHMGVIKVQADDEPDYLLGMDSKQVRVATWTNFQACLLSIVCFPSVYVLYTALVANLSRALQEDAIPGMSDIFNTEANMFTTDANIDMVKECLNVHS